jgi:hypothetical protein
VVEAEARELVSRLAEIDVERRSVIGRLKELGYIRGRGLVGEIGERIAAAWYGVELAPPSQPGYDLVWNGQRIQVRTLLMTPENHRTTLGTPKEPFDLLFALRIDATFIPLEAIEVPKAVLAEYYGGGRASWTKRLAADPRVGQISHEQLLARMAS